MGSSGRERRVHLQVVLKILGQLGHFLIAGGAQDLEEWPLKLAGEQLCKKLHLECTSRMAGVQ